MAKQWMEIKNEIEDEIDRIWFKAPEELVSVMKGEIPSGANIDGSPMCHMYYMTFETSKIGRHVINPGISAALDDDAISLETIKKMWYYLSDRTVNRMGGVLNKDHPEPWMNMAKPLAFWNDIKAAMPDVKTKEEFREVFYSWINYLTCLNYWGYILFPWEIAWYNGRVSACTKL